MSLTVPPSVAFTCLTSDSSARAQDQRRCAPTGPFSEQSGVGLATSRMRISPRAASLPRWLSARGARRAHSGLERPHGDRGEGAREQLRLAGCRGRLPPRRQGAWRVGRRVEHDAQQVRAGDAIDHAVMDLRDQRPRIRLAGKLQPLHHPHLPQRLAAVQLLGHHAPDHHVQLLLAARRGQGAVAQVVLEVEVGVVDPHGPPCAERDEAHHLAVARHQWQLGEHHLVQLLRLRGWALEQRDRGDVHVADRVLDVEERGVKRAERLHPGGA